MQLVVITPEHTLADEMFLVNAMLDRRLQRLHIRKPSFTKEEYARYISSISEAHHSRLVIHGSFELLEEFDLAGIHLNSTLRTDSTTLSNLTGIEPKKISTSFHSWDEIIQNDFGYGYVFISPVFNSISKPGYQAAIDLNGAKATQKILEQQERYCPKIIGLGGVGQQRLQTLQNHGFDGAAMLGAIWQSDDPLSVFQECLALAGD